MTGGDQDGEDRHASYDPESLGRDRLATIRFYTLQRLLDALQTHGEIPWPRPDLLPELLELLFDHSHALKRLRERGELLRLLLLDAPR